MYLRKTDGRNQNYLLAPFALVIEWVALTKIDHSLPTFARAFPRKPANPASASAPTVGAAPGPAGADRFASSAVDASDASAVAALASRLPPPAPARARRGRALRRSRSRPPPHPRLHSPPTTSSRCARGPTLAATSRSVRRSPAAPTAAAFRVFTPFEWPGPAAVRS